MKKILLVILSTSLISSAFAGVTPPYASRQPNAVTVTGKYPPNDPKQGVITPSTTSVTIIGTTGPVSAKSDTRKPATQNGNHINITTAPVTKMPISQTRNPIS